MNVGHIITSAMRDQRTRDLRMLRRAVRFEDYNRFEAWLMFGWKLYPNGRHLGIPGECWPFWTEPRHLLRHSKL